MSEKQVRGDQREDVLERSNGGAGPAGDAQEREVAAEDVEDDQHGGTGKRGSADTRFGVC